MTAGIVRPALHRRYRILAVEDHAQQYLVGRILTVTAIPARQSPTPNGLFHAKGFVEGSAGIFSLCGAFAPAYEECNCDLLSFPHKRTKACR